MKWKLFSQSGPRLKTHARRKNCATSAGGGPMRDADRCAKKALALAIFWSAPKRAGGRAGIPLDWFARRIVGENFPASRFYQRAPRAAWLILSRAHSRFLFSAAVDFHLFTFRAVRELECERAREMMLLPDTCTRKRVSPFPRHFAFEGRSKPLAIHTQCWCRSLHFCCQLYLFVSSSFKPISLHTVIEGICPLRMSCIYLLKSVLPFIVM